MQLEMVYEEENIIDKTMRILNMNTESLANYLNILAYQEKINFTTTRGRVVNWSRGHANITPLVTKLCVKLLNKR